MTTLELEPALVARLKADPAVAAIVGDRIYPGLADDGAAVPYVTYHRISTQRLRTLDGPDGHARPRIQFDSWAVQYGDAKAAARAIRLCLNGFRGDLPGPVRVNQISLVDERDDEDTSGERRLRRTQQDFMIRHEEDR